MHIDDAFNYYFSKKKSYKETLVSVIQLSNKMGWIMEKNNQNYISFAIDEVKKKINQHLLMSMLSKEKIHNLILGQSSSQKNLKMN